MYIDMSFRLNFHIESISLLMFQKKCLKYFLNNELFLFQRKLWFTSDFFLTSPYLCYSGVPGNTMYITNYEMEFPRHEQTKGS